MEIELLKSKIHRVKVTQANVNYIGSITIDEDFVNSALSCCVPVQTKNEDVFLSHLARFVIHIFTQIDQELRVE